jgi:hypothetical protein
MLSHIHKFRLSIDPQNSEHEKIRQLFHTVMTLKKAIPKSQIVHASEGMPVMLEVGTESYVGIDCVRAAIDNL